MSEPVTFRALFAAHLPVRRATLSIEDCPNEGWVDFRALNKAKLDEFQALSTDVGKDAEGNVVFVPKQDPSAFTKAMRFLVGHSVVDFCLWTPGKSMTTGETNWTQLKPSSGGRDRVALIGDLLADSLPEFWDWIVGECLKTNGFGNDQEGN